MQDKDLPKSGVRKGDLLERVVAYLHQLDGVQVSTRERIRRREFDVVVRGTLARHPAMLIFECKDHGKPIGAKEIEAFAGKLRHVGLPTQFGKFVTTSSFTKGAIESAETAGIQLINAQGLNASGLGLTTYPADII